MYDDQMRQMRHCLVLLSCALGLTHCPASQEAGVEERPPAHIPDNPPAASLVARVNGAPITAEAVARLVDETDGGVAAEAAVEALIHQELLAAEARQREWHAHVLVSDARRRAMARAALREKIERQVTADTIDRDKLRRYYEKNINHYVHPVLRRVVHIVFMVKKQQFTDDDARSLAEQAAEEANTLTSVEDFSALGARLVETHGTKVKIEPLPPFSKDSKQFVSEFVKGAFGSTPVGRASPAIKTKFGWHVLFIQEEIEKQNQTFDEIANQLAEQVLPAERELRTQQWLERLLKKGPVFIYEDALTNLIESP